MKKFVLKTLLLLLPIIIIALLMEVLLRLIPNDYRFKKKYLDAHSGEIETLILGSSHSFYGIDPVYFSENTFNASYNSQSLNYDYEILKKYQDRFENLKTVVLPVSYFTLFGKLEDGPDKWLIKNYILYYRINTSRKFSDHTEILSNKFNVNLRRLVSYYIKGNTNSISSGLGWGTAYKSENAQDLTETGKTTALRHTRKDIESIKYTEIIKDNILVLNTIIKWCKNRHVKVILFTPPAYETYREFLNTKQLIATFNIVNELDAKYDNCIYINLLSDPTFIARDFYDSDHLSEIGAKKLSKIFDDRITDLGNEIRLTGLNIIDKPNGITHQKISSPLNHDHILVPEYLLHPSTVTWEWIAGHLIIPDLYYDSGKINVVDNQH